MSITLAASIAESVMQRSGLSPFVRLSVCPVGILIVTHHGAACDATSVHFGQTIRRTDTLVEFVFVFVFHYIACMSAVRHSGEHGLPNIGHRTLPKIWVGFLFKAYIPWE